uniref:Uncharacterized protein n=1 Tax=Arundo donax TaxID=35708 RepID=A0A0A8YBM3_ARUDO
MVNLQDQRDIENVILGLGIMVEEKIRADTGMINHLRDREMEGREVMTDMFREEKDQKDTNMMWNMMT